MNVLSEDDMNGGHNGVHVQLKVNPTFDKSFKSNDSDPFSWSGWPIPSCRVWAPNMTA